MRTYIKFLMLAVAGVCLGFFVWFGLFAQAQSSAQEKSNRPTLSKLPPIKNCTDHIKLINAQLVEQGGSQVAVLEVENEAYVGVVSISVEQIVNKERHSVVPSGFTADQPPQIVIPPGGRKTITLGNLGDKPIRIGGVMFADGTEEGCGFSLKSMRELKDFRMKKGGSQK